MKVADVMTVEVITVDKDKTVQEAANIMSQNRVGAIIVTDGERVVGIMTERDILLKVVAKSIDPKTTKVSDIMTREVILVKPDLELDDAAEIMLEHDIKRLPVIKGSRLVGIVTTVDMIRASPQMIKRLSELMHIPKKDAVAG